MDNRTIDDIENDMTLDELEQMRFVLLQQAIKPVEKLMPAIIDNWQAHNYSSYGRMFYELKSTSGVMIQWSLVDQTYNRQQKEFDKKYSIWVLVEKEYVSFQQVYVSGETIRFEMEFPCFARAHSVNWIAELENLALVYNLSLQGAKENADTLRKEQLINLLTKGEMK